MPRKTTPQKSNSQKSKAKTKKSSKKKLKRNNFKIIFEKLKNIFAFDKPQATESTASKPAEQDIKSRVLNKEYLSSFESFASKIVEDVMIPRSDIIAVAADIGFEELSKLIVEHNHTRILVYNDNLDNIIGFVHIKDLFKMITESRNFNLRKLLRQNLVSPMSMRLSDLLSEMQLKRIHISVVVDEYGGTDGIVTIEDIVEAIVGRIDDEHDDIDSNGFKVLKSGTVISDARVEVSELEEALKIKLKTEEGEFDTIGGLVLAKSGSIPTRGEIIEIADDITVEILDSTPRTIKQLKIIFNAKNTSDQDKPKQL